MRKIRIAVVGVGNCASSLIQGMEYYRHKQAAEAIGLMHWEIGGYKPSDIEVTAAFDIDKRKVGRDVNEAIFARPNCTAVFCREMPKTGVVVRMGRVLDGYAEHMKDYEEEYSFVVAKGKEPMRDEVVSVLKKSGAEILMNYLPVGAEDATKFYAEACLEAGVAFVNNIPVFIASNAAWAKRFEERGLPVIGDDIKAQLGATITHRTLTDLFK
jgi:myo-inositol-1-phosphate synthase